MWCCGRDDVCQSPCRSTWWWAQQRGLPHQPQDGRLSLSPSAAGQCCRASASGASSTNQEHHRGDDEPDSAILGTNVPRRPSRRHVHAHQERQEELQRLLDHVAPQLDREGWLVRVLPMPSRYRDSNGFHYSAAATDDGRQCLWLRHPRARLPKSDQRTRRSRDHRCVIQLVRGRLCAAKGRNPSSEGRYLRQHRHSSRKADHDLLDTGAWNESARAEPRRFPSERVAARLPALRH
jgi:hypothetical protein